MIVQAVAQLPVEWRERMTLRIIGEGPEEHRLKTEVKELGLEDRVEFLGEVPSWRMHAHYSESDLFVLASSAEGLSNALLEAMWHGLPCFHATLTGIEEIDSVIVPFRSAKSLSKKLLAHLENPERLLRLGKNARQVAQKQTWRRAAACYDKLLRQVASC